MKTRVLNLEGNAALPRIHSEALEKMLIDIVQLAADAPGVWMDPCFGFFLGTLHVGKVSIKTKIRIIQHLLRNKL